MEKKRVLLLIIVLALLLSTVLSGCNQNQQQTTGLPQTNESSNTEVPKTEYPKGALEFVAPSAAGGGWDLTIRTVAKALQDTKLTTVPMPVTNRVGGGGAVHLGYLQEKKGSDAIISVYSPPILLINLNGTTELSYKDTTPLARLIADYGVFVVNKDSEYNNINEVMDALKEDPKSVKIGGTSSAGSMDHLQFLIAAKAAGVTRLSEIDYVALDSGAPAILGGHIDLLTTGIGENIGLIESGEMKALAQTSDVRLGSGLVAEIPNLIEEGIDATFVNWRGLFGPPNMPEYAVEYWRNTLAELVKTQEWDKAKIRNNWSDAYLDKEEFEAFLETENERIKSIMQELGMIE